MTTNGQTSKIIEDTFAKNTRRTTPGPEAVALITSAHNLEALYLATAQAVALDNPREGARLALQGMMYADIKSGLQQLATMVAAAQAADAAARVERTATETAAAAERSARADREAAREEELHVERLAQSRLCTEREELRNKKLRETGSEY